MAPARGMAGDVVGAGVVGVMATMVVVAMATMAAVAMVMVAGSLGDAASSVGADLHVVRLAASADQWAVGFMAALWPTVVAGSTVAEGSTVVAVDTGAADTGNRRGISL